MTRKKEVREKIYKALEELVQTRSLSDVKVMDLCRISGVHRSTFYTYFKDIYDIPHQMWDDMMEPTLYKIGYVGGKRFVKLLITEIGTTTGMPQALLVLKGHLRDAPIVV